MILESVRLQKCKETLEKCEKESCGDPKVIINAIEDLVDLVASSPNHTTKMDASHIMCHFILEGSYFTEDDKKTFLTHLFEEGCRRLGQGFLDPTIH